MFEKTPQFYDRIYAFKDYAAEAEKLRALIAQHRPAPASTLLDVACGTGQHLSSLRQYFDHAEGIDLDAGLLAVAQNRNPEVPLHQVDMTNFNLSRGFDVVTCLFSSIGYVRTLAGLRAAVACMAGHLVPGGLLLIEPWFTPESYQTGLLSSLFINDPELKVARMNITQTVGAVSVLEFHYLVGTPTGIDRFVERHELGLFTRQEYTDALSGEGLVVTYDQFGLTGRGLYIGRQPL